MVPILCRLVMSHYISSILLPYILHGTVRGVVSLVPIPAQLVLVMMVAHRQVVMEESVLITMGSRYQ